MTSDSGARRAAAAQRRRFAFQPRRPRRLALPAPLASSPRAGANQSDP